MGRPSEKERLPLLCAALWSWSISFMEPGAPRGLASADSRRRARVALVSEEIF